MDPHALRDDFPALDRTVNGQPLAYLDNAATTQKPRSVIEAVSEFYERHNANVHRCVHTLATEATQQYDTAHATVADFIGAAPAELAFTRNTTEALNTAAASVGMTLDADDEVVLTEMDHHSHILPWQRAAQRSGATLRYARVTDGELDMDHLRELVSDDTAVVGVPQVSNVLGCAVDIAAVADIAHDHDALCVVDAAQSVPHMPVDVEALGCDLLACSGHKMLGPTGIGVLYGRRSLLERLEPGQVGGGMIRSVSKQDATWADLPAKWEAGTPPIAQAVGLAAAVEYLDEVGMDAVQAHSQELARDAAQRLSALDDVTVYGPAERIGVVSFTVDGAHPHDLSTLLNEDGVAVRGGHHCAQPLGERLGVSSTTRASVYLYNTLAEIDQLVESVQRAVEVFG